MDEIKYGEIDTKHLSIFEMADLVNQPIHITTPDGIVRFVNKAWSLVYKVKPEDAIGKPIQAVIELNEYFFSFNKNLTPDIADAMYEHIEKPSNRSAATIAVERGEPVTMMTITPGGDKVIVSATPIFDEAGKITCIFTIVQDLTMLGRWRDVMDEETEKLEQVKRELENLRGSVAHSDFVGESDSVEEIRNLINIIAPSDAGVLITGESGTGKEIVAKEIYAHSSRKDKPFITVNCAAIPGNLLESELFGHEKGSFTGAVAAKVGLFETANHGTLMLDEIGDIPLQLQPKLLRVLQERELRRVGGTRKIPVDVRVIAATNSDLQSKVKNGSFRADLFYRLNVFPIRIPPLRERKDDIMPLANTFLKKFNAKYRKRKFFTRRSADPLMRYDWPGNVRELENIIERIVIMGSDPVISYGQVKSIVGISDDFDERADISISGAGLKGAVERVERELIAEALKKYGSTYKAAEALKTSQSTIMRRMKALGITKAYTVVENDDDR